MPRLTREQLRNVEDAQRHVVTTRPAVVGGFPWLALAPLAAAAATPLLGSLGKWAGKKIFGEGIQRAGERPPQLPMKMRGGAMAMHRAGDYPMPSLAPLPHYKSSTQGGLPGAGVGLRPIPSPIPISDMKVLIKGKGKKSKCSGGKLKKGSAAAKAKMAALRAMKKKA